MQVPGMLVRAGFALALALASLPALARLDIDPQAQAGTATWNGGDVSRSFDFCVLSTQEAQPTGTTPVPYAVSAAAPFNLDSGAATVPVTLIWRDLTNGNTRTLAPDTATNEDFTGAPPGCPGGNNGQLEISITEADLASVGPGTYSQTFDLQVTNSGGGKKQANFSVDLDLTLPEAVQITQVDDINLGTFDGVNDINAVDTLCVYRNSGGAYGVTVTGSGNGGAFTVENSGSVIPFSVTWNDGNGAQPVSPGNLIGGLGNSYVGDSSCAGGANNNAILGVQVLANDILGAATTTGTHTGILTIMVEIQ